MKNNTAPGIQLLAKWLLNLCVASAMLCASAHAQKPESPANSKSEASDASKDTSKDTSKDEGKDASKVEVRNNAASLLDDLLGDEKHVSLILIIKHHPAELGHLIKAISKTSGDGGKELEAMAADDKSLNLHALQLPPGEIATRAAISKTQEHELLFSSGEKFEVRLLLTQANALDYGSHLAQIAADNSTSPEQARRFHGLQVRLNALYQRVVANFRALPAK
jgi:hypothetical protein